MKIIPAIDLIDGKCVRLTQGDYRQQKVYNENPVEIAKQFEAAGFTHLHVVDLDGAKVGALQNLSTLKNLLADTTLKIDVGGGIKKEEDIQLLFDLGVSQVNLGSIAVKNQDLVSTWLYKFGLDRIIISADVRNEKIALHGWQEQSDLSIYDFIKLFDEPRLFVTCTDIATDGMLSGPNVELYQNIQTAFPEVRLIASGGVSQLSDLEVLKKLNISGVIIGKALYENKISLAELSAYVD